MSHRSITFCSWWDSQCPNCSQKILSAKSIFCQIVEHKKYSCIIFTLHCTRFVQFMFLFYVEVNMCSFKWSFHRFASTLMPDQPLHEFIIHCSSRSFKILNIVCNEHDEISNRRSDLIALFHCSVLFWWHIANYDIV